MTIIKCRRMCLNKDSDSVCRLTEITLGRTGSSSCWNYKKDKTYPNFSFKEKELRNNEQTKKM